MYSEKQIMRIVLLVSIVNLELPFSESARNNQRIYSNFSKNHPTDETARNCSPTIEYKYM